MMWPRHALAVFLLAALNLGLYGRLYSPLDHAFPEGEAASAAVTRFVGENPHPWGWNPEKDGGQPTQTVALPAFHYAAALLTKLGNEPLYAHRILAVTLALLAPLVLYWMLLSFGLSWGAATGMAFGIALLSPFQRHDGSPLSFLPARLHYLEQSGDAPFVAGLTFLLVALPLLWRAGLRRDAASLFVAAVSIAVVLLTSGAASLVLGATILMLEVAMLGIAGEYRFSHRRIFAAMLWGYLLSCFWLGDRGFTSGFDLPWLKLLLGAIIIRLLFLGRRQPFLCFTVLSLWALSYLTYRLSIPALEIALELFVLLAFLTIAVKCFEQRSWLFRALTLVPLICLLILRADIRPHAPRLPLGSVPVVEPTASRIYLLSAARLKAQVQEWRGTWGMRPPSESEAFKATRWLVEHPPKGRVQILHPNLSPRLNAWVPFAQTQTVRDNDAEYRIWRPFPDRHLPALARIGGLAVDRLPFTSLAGTTGGSPLEFEWLRSSRIRVTGKLAKPESLLVKVNHHPGWQAQLNGQTVPVGRSDLGFMTFTPPAGPIDLQLEFNGTGEQHFWGYLSAFTWLASLGYVAFRSWRR